MSPIWLDPGEEAAEFIGTASDRANAKIKDVNARAPQRLCSVAVLLRERFRCTFFLHASPSCRAA